MRRFLLFILYPFVFSPLFSQTVERIKIPDGIVYNYCDVETYENAKKLVEKELTTTPEYALTGSILFIGPNLWKRFKKVKKLGEIEGGNVTLMNMDMTGKMTQNTDDSKLVWDQLYKEVGGKGFKLRKANTEELTYYWSVISFDIDEPLIIIDTKEHKYILNLSPKDYKLIWLDETP